MSFSKLACLNSIMKFVWIDYRTQERMSAHALVFLSASDLDPVYLQMASHARKACARSAPSLSSHPKVAFETTPMFVGLTHIAQDLPGRNVDSFLSPLLFPSGCQCCDTLPYPRSESSPNLYALLLRQAVDSCCVCCACHCQSISVIEWVQTVELSDLYYDIK